MTLDDFAMLLDRHGSDPAQWPDPERQRALALLARSPEAAGMFERHRRFEALFAAAQIPDPPSTARIVARATARRPRHRLFPWAIRPHGGWRLGWPQLAGLAACLLVGFVVGILTPAEHDAAAEFADFAVSPALEFGNE
jgi:hypothetical protein